MENNLLKVFNNIKKHPLEYLTLLLAVIGAFFSSDPSSQYRLIGFSLWVISNGYMLYGFIMQKNVPYSILFFLYEIFNIRGIISNWN